jgi:N6-adenosine-specific RNA methylase IME4
MTRHEMSAQNRAHADLYKILLADPPWRYAHCRSKSKAVEKHYATLTLRQIAAMPVQSLAAKDALLFLWTTSPHLESGLTVLRSWGFQYVTNGCWDKGRIGQGYHFRQQHELILVGKRGKPGTPHTSHRISSVIQAKRGAHSVKPVELYEYLERAYPGARKLELFARSRRKGWDAWGNEVVSDIRLPDPAV